jgi:hypothetical protein
MYSFQNYTPTPSKHDVAKKTSVNVWWEVTCKFNSFRIVKQDLSEKTTKKKLSVQSFGVFSNFGIINSKINYGQSVTRLTDSSQNDYIPPCITIVDIKQEKGFAGSLSSTSDWESTGW